MVKTTLTHDRSQAGFTLVELAIVMIIIGLLIGGILKGQELIQNAQVTATSSQIKAIESAMTTFRDSYNAVPGDMTNPGARLPNCTAAPCSNGGNGNNRVDSIGVGVAQDSTNENARFWTQLAAADMIGGVDSTSTNVTTWGGQLLASESGGGFTVGYAAGGAIAASGLAGALGTNAVAGHYVSIQSLPSAAANAGTNLALTPTQAARIDRKIDDGVATTGGVRGIGGDTCAPNTGIYAEAAGGTNCNIYARVQ